MMETLELAERTASPLFVPLLSTLTTMHYFAGRWDEAVTDLDVVLEDLDELHDRVVLMVRSHGLRALIAARRDEREIAAWHLEAIAGLPIEPGRLRANAVFATVARAVLAERDGRPSDALAKLSGSLDPDYGNDMRYVMLPTVARLAMSLGEHDTARAAAAASAEDAAADPTPPRLAAAEVCRGLADADPARLLSSGVADRIELRPVEAAEALENAAVLLAQSGEVARAREVAEKALGVYAAVGAAWDVVRCESRIRAWGIRRGKRGVRAGRAASGWGALTPMELRVAALVAEGRSNPEIAAELFLSRRTVQTHVSHILAKLGARSRVEIAAEAAKNP